MAVDLWPYSGRNDGTVTDAEHEALWRGEPDGVLPNQASNAMAVGVSGTTWTVQPGLFRIAGHVLSLDAVESGALPGGASSTRTSVVTAYLDRTQTPWQYGVRLALGQPGGGRPNLSTSLTGLYEVALRSFTTSTAGATSLGLDERPYTEGMPWQTYTPHWTNAGSATFGTRTGRWRRIGPKHVVGTIYVTMSGNGTSSSIVQTSLPTAPARTVRQVFHGHTEDPAAVLEAVTFTGGSGNWVDRILEVNSAITANLIGSRCMSGRLFVIHFDYEEA